MKQKRVLPVRFADLAGKHAIVTGAGGAICGAIARALASQGVRVAVWDLCLPAARATVEQIQRDGGEAEAFECNVLDAGQVEAALERTRAWSGEVDILINGAGGSRLEATTSPAKSFADIAPQDLMNTLALNYLSAVIPAQAVAPGFARRARGVILNVASIAGISPLTQALGYSNGKAALVSFTQWLAVHLAREYSPRIRVNALAPGFVLTEQNRFLLIDQNTGEATERGRLVQNQVPMQRYGEPEEMTAASLWLVSDTASFVTGAVIPIDGGFSAFSGV